MKFSFVCACCGAGIYDLESAEATDRETGRRYVICFDCADRYTNTQALQQIRKRYGQESRPTAGTQAGKRKRRQGAP